jgi:hypothetical protein
MTYLSKLYRAVLIALSLAAATPAQALLLNTGDVVVYNFDSTGVLAPPYFEVEAIFSFVGVGEVTFEAFDGLNATGAFLAGPIDTAVASIITLIAQSPTSPPGLLDGIFSIELIATQRPFQITSILGDAFLPDGPGTPFTPAIGTVGNAPNPRRSRFSASASLDSV